MLKKMSFKAYTALITLGGFVFFLFQTALCMDVMSVILASIEDTRGWSAADLNAVTSAATFAGVVAPFVLGTIFMKLGLKRVLFGCVVISAAAAVIMGTVVNIYVFGVCLFLVQFICQAMTVGFIGIIGNWFLGIKGRVLGLVTIAAPFSTAFFTPFSNWLLSSFGFTTLWMVMGIMWLVLGTVFLAMIPATPEEVGYHVDGGKVAAQKPEAVKSKWTTKLILSKKESWFLIIGLGAIYLMSTSIMSQFITRMTMQGIETETAVWILSAAAILGMPLSYLWGLLDDKISAPKATALFLLSFTAITIALLFAGPDNVALVYAVGVLIAATTGGMPNLIPSCISWVFGGSEYVNVNRTIGTFHQLFRSLAFLLMSVVLSVTGVHDVAFMIFIPLSVIAAIMVFSIKRSYDPMNPAYKEDASITEG